MRPGLVIAIVLTTAVFMILVHAKTSDECKGEDDFWDSEDNTCKVCIRCGKGWQTTAEQCGSGIGVQGHCEECQPGYYQDHDHTKNPCRPCSSCHQDNGVRESTPCSSLHDTLCECLPGYVDVEGIENICVACIAWEGSEIPDECKQTSTSQSSSRYISSGSMLTSQSPTLTPTTQPFSRISPSPAIKNPTEVNQDDQDKVMSDGAIAGVAISAMVLVIIVTLAVCVCYYWKKLGFSQLPQSDDVHLEESTPNREYQRSQSSPADCKSPADYKGSTPIVPVNTRDAVNKLTHPSKAKENANRGETAKGKGSRIYIDTLDFNVLQKLHQKLNLSRDNNDIQDWRNLATKWGYSHEDISFMLNENAGFLGLVEKEKSQNPNGRTVEALINDLQAMKRNDAAKVLIDNILESE